MYHESNSLLLDAPGPAVATPSAPVPVGLDECRRLATGLSASGYRLLSVDPGRDDTLLTPIFDGTFPRLSPLTRWLISPDGDRFARDLAEASAPVWWRPDSAAAPDLERACWPHRIDAPGRSRTPGLSLSVFAENGRRGLFVFDGSDLDLGDELICETHWRCFTIFDEVTRDSAAKGDGLPNVSKRELECLKLTAKGMTSDEIANELGLSVHTANQYLTNSTHKLNAVNRIHAVAKALRIGLID